MEPGASARQGGECRLTERQGGLDAYRQGVGHRLLQQAIARCDGTLSTEVLVGDEPALALFLSAGYRIVKHIDGKLTGKDRFAASGDVVQRVAGAA